MSAVRGLDWPLTLAFLAGSLLLLALFPLWLSIPASVGLGVALLLLQPWLSRPAVRSTAAALVLGLTGAAAAAYVLARFGGLDLREYVLVLLFAGGCLLALSLRLIMSAPQSGEATRLHLALLAGGCLLVAGGVKGIVWSRLDWEIDDIAWTRAALIFGLGALAGITASAFLLHRRMMGPP